MRHFLTLSDVSPEELRSIITLGHEVKKHPDRYREALSEKTLLMLFELPSLRTRISFEVGMEQMGGHGLYYQLSESTLGKKESVRDFAKVSSRMCDAIMARTKHHHLVSAIADHADVPVINALSDYAHPCQILCDFVTIEERKEQLTGLTLAFVGDGLNNMAHSLIEGCARMGMHVRIGCPKGSDFEPRHDVIVQSTEYARRSGGTIAITHDPLDAVQGADIVYADSWMSYRVAHEEQERRYKLFEPFQVNANLMKHAKPDALFMHCMPATRGAEVTNDIMDGPQSVVYDQAENRMHGQKALLLFLLANNA